MAALAAGLASCQRTIAGNGSAWCHAGVRRPVNFEWLASKLKVVGGVCPSGLSVRLLLSKVDNDEERYASKSYQTRHGPAPLLTKKKRRAVADDPCC